MTSSLRLSIHRYSRIIKEANWGFSIVLDLFILHFGLYAFLDYGFFSFKLT